MKQIILTTLVIFQSIGHATQINCQTVAKNAWLLQINIKVENAGVNLKQTVKGTTVFSGPRIYSVYHTDYSIGLFWMRIGYRQSFSTQIPNGPMLSISGRSLTNEGPISKLNGALIYHPGTAEEKSVSLNCRLLDVRVLDGLE